MKPIEGASGPDERRRPDGDADTPDGSTGEGDAGPEPFRPLGEYEWPSTPVDRGLKRLVGTVRKRLFADDEGEGIDLSRLAAAERSVLDGIVAPPANRPLTDELDATLADWLDGAEEEGDVLFSHVRVVVLPPCDEEDFIRGWSEAHGFALPEAPDRSGRADPPELPGQPGDIVVAPRLGDWFLRHDAALAGIVALFERPYGAVDRVEIDGDYGEVVSVARGR